MWNCACEKERHVRHKGLLMRLSIFFFAMNRVAIDIQINKRLFYPCELMVTNGRREFNQGRMKSCAWYGALRLCQLVVLSCICCLGFSSCSLIISEGCNYYCISCVRFGLASGGASAPLPGRRALLFVYEAVYARLA